MESIEGSTLCESFAQLSNSILETKAAGKLIERFWTTQLRAFARHSLPLFVVISQRSRLILPTLAKKAHNDELSNKARHSPMYSIYSLSRTQMNNQLIDIERCFTAGKVTFCMQSTQARNFFVRSFARTQDESSQGEESVLGRRGKGENFFSLSGARAEGFGKHLSPLKYDFSPSFLAKDVRNCSFVRSLFLSTFFLASLEECYLHAEGGEETRTFPLFSPFKSPCLE